MSFRVTAICCHTIFFLPWSKLSLKKIINDLFEGMRVVMSDMVRVKTGANTLFCDTVLFFMLSLSVNYAQQ